MSNAMETETLNFSDGILDFSDGHQISSADHN